MPAAFFLLTRFISLSGMSGVMAGIYAIIGAVAAHFVIEQAKQTDGLTNANAYEVFKAWNENTVLLLLLIAGIVLLLAILTAFILTRKKAEKTKQKLWGAQTMRLIASFLTPLSIGGLFTLVLLQYGVIGLIAPAMLIFYGLACMSASKYTLGTVKYLGLTCAILGLINTQFIGYGLYFWAAGFGVTHIIYGIIMYNKYDLNK